MKSNFNFSILVSVLLFFSCDTSNNPELSNNSIIDIKEGESISRGYASGAVTTATWTNENENIPVNRKIIWTGNLELQVSNVDLASQSIDSLCSKYNAFVSNMRLTNDRYQISNNITIRVNNKDFNNLINEIKGQSIYTKKIGISSNDVSEEFVDIESRLKTKKDVRERYINILNTKTGDIKDVLEAEEAIRKITEEIEAKEGRLRYLKDQVSFSTINLELFQKVEFKNVPETYEKSFLSKSSEALKNGWSMVTGIFYGLLNIWPLLILLILILWKRKRIGRLFKK